MQPKNQMAYPKSKKQRSYKSLVKTLDRLFSEFIRRRDSDGAGICRCITCTRTAHWKAMDAGHFIQRDRLATRWMETNVHAQCPYCNRYRSGEQFEHGQAIDRTHGKGTAEQLRQMGAMRGTKVDLGWLELQIEVYKNKLKNI